MIFHLSVMAADATTEQKLAKALQDSVKGLIELNVACASQSRKEMPENEQVLFVDHAIPNLDRVLEAIDRKRKAVFLIIKEGSKIPQALENQKVDDVLVHPFRPLEVLSKLRHYQQILMWDEVAHLNESFSELLERLHTDLQLAERLQKAKLPKRFPEIKGFKIINRYLAGLRSGGDHFDIAESKDGGQLSLVLSDSSSYGLSSSLLSVLMRVAVKLTQDQMGSTYEVVRRIQEELLITLGERDRLSLFYGSLSRKDYKLKYLNLGTSCAFYARKGQDFSVLPSQGEPITQRSGFVMGEEAVQALEPEGRLVLVSDGFVESVGGIDAMKSLLDEFRKREAVDTANELVFKLKSKWTEPDQLPDQDCTCVIFDVDSRLIRLAN